ncbi:hypothetical protein [Metakosakonia massiliensis]
MHFFLKKRKYRLFTVTAPGAVARINGLNSGNVNGISL